MNIIKPLINHYWEYRGRRYMHRCFTCWMCGHNHWRPESLLTSPYWICRGCGEIYLLTFNFGRSTIHRFIGKNAAHSSGPKIDIHDSDDETRELAERILYEFNTLYDTEGRVIVNHFPRSGR